jgi:two-component system cell cycle sensor histidine kinase/response regulator CckA
MTGQRRTAAPTVEVLLVEDNPGDARLVKESLAEATARSFHLTHVERLEDAIRRLERDRFDVVLLDLLLQDSQRLGTLMEIHHQAPKVPIVVFTGLEDDVVGLWALSEGAEDYVVKGNVSGDSLAYTICEAIDRHGKEALIHDPARVSRKEHQP